MADAEESNRFSRYYTVYCPEGHLCNMGGRHLKYSKTVSDARHKLAQHLHSGQGHSAQFQDWEFCMTAAARETYIEYTYDAEADRWWEPVDVGYTTDEERAAKEAEDRPRPPPEAPPAKRPRTPRRQMPQSSSAAHEVQPERVPVQDQQQAPPTPPRVAPPQLGLINREALVAPGAFGPRAGYLPTGNPDTDFQRRLRIFAGRGKIGVFGGPAQRAGG